MLGWRKVVFGAVWGIWVVGWCGEGKVDSLGGFSKVWIDARAMMLVEVGNAVDMIYYLYAINPRGYLSMQYRWRSDRGLEAGIYRERYVSLAGSSLYHGYPEDELFLQMHFRRRYIAYLSYVRRMLVGRRMEVWAGVGLTGYREKRYVHLEIPWVAQLNILGWRQAVGFVGVGRWQYRVTPGVWIGFFVLRHDFSFYQENRYFSWAPGAGMGKQRVERGWHSVIWNVGFSVGGNVGGGWRLKRRRWGG